MGSHNTDTDNFCIATSSCSNARRTATFQRRVLDLRTRGIAARGSAMATLWNRPPKLTDQLGSTVDKKSALQSGSAYVITAATSAAAVRYGWVG